MKKSIILLLFLTMCSGGSEQAQTETTSQAEDMGGVTNQGSEPVSYTHLTLPTIYSV